MAGRPPKRRAEDQHSISSFFRTKRPDKDMEAATSVSSEEERIDDEPCFDVNVVEEQSPSGVASGGEVTSAAGDMVQCQSRSEASSSCQTQYNKLVFKALSGESCTEEEKRCIIAGRTPPTNCDLPYTLVRDQRKQSGYSKRFLQRQSFANFDWLAYYDGDGDTDKAGVFCLACSLFPAVHREGSRRADYFVTKIQTNFKKLREDALRHDGLEYHRDSGIRLKTFLTTSQQHSLRLDARMTEESKKRVDANRAILLSIIRCLELAGRQGISLRGHRDNLTEDSPQGNFHALIRFAIASGDTILKTHLENCARNATYMSNNVQNQLLSYMADELLSQVVSNVKKSRFYGIQADEVADVSGMEQLGLSVRYVIDGESIKQHVAFMECQSTTGKAICSKIVDELGRLQIDVKLCRAQAYDGAGAMSGHLNGCQTLFREIVPEAAYYHCSSHQLNLALSKACDVKPIQCMLADFKSLGIFFKYSPKRQQCMAVCTACLNNDLKAEGKPLIPELKLKLLSTTRWVERHTAVSDFCSIYEAVIYCLQVLSHAAEAQSKEEQSEAGVKKPYEIGRFDGKTVGEANGLLHALSSDSFLVALRSNLYMSGYLKPLSVLLQGSHLDILEANKEISRVIQLLEENREKSEEKFHPIFQATCNMTLLHGRPTPEIPRQAGRQTQRSNVPATTPEEYWRRSVFVPFLDTLIAELNGRFSAMSKKAVQALLLMAENLDRLTDGAISDLHEAFLSDLPDDSSFVAELERWRKKWEGVPPESLPTSMKDLLSLHLNSLSYPNLSRIFHLLMIIPVTSANVERANSSLKFIKTDLRSRMTQSRLNALLLLFIHKSIPVNPEAVVERFARAHPRRLLFTNPLIDDPADVESSASV